MGKTDSTDDIRPGLGWDGVTHLQNFVNEGGVLVTVADTANLAITTGFAQGVSIARPRDMKLVGSDRAGGHRGRRKPYRLRLRR